MVPMATSVIMAALTDRDTSCSSSGHRLHPPVPSCIQWSEEEVAKWIEDIGFKQYKVIHDNCTVLEGTNWCNAVDS